MFVVGSISWHSSAIFGTPKCSLPHKAIETSLNTSLKRRCDEVDDELVDVRAKTHKLEERLRKVRAQEMEKTENSQKLWL